MITSSAQHRVCGSRHSIRLGGTRLLTTYKPARARPAHREPGPPSLPWVLSLMLGLLVIRPVW